MVKKCPAGKFAEINVPFPTVGSIICRFKQYGKTPRKINAWGSGILLRTVKNNQMIIVRAVTGLIYK